MRGWICPRRDLFFTLLLVLPACLFRSSPEEGVKNFYLASDFAKNGIRRVGCLPLEKETYCHEDLSTIQFVFLKELQRAGVFEVVPVAPEEAEPLSRLTKRKGAYPSQWILGVKRQYRVDGILLARVIQYNPYEPKTLGIRGELLDSRTGDVIWSVDVIIDSSDPGTLEDMKRFFAPSSVNETPFGWKLPLFSKKNFLRYACSKIFQTLSPEFKTVERTDPHHGQ